MLIETLIPDALQQDQKENLNKRKGQQKNTHLTNIQTNIRSCGISFDIWEKTKADGKGSDQYDFASLLRSDKEEKLMEPPGKLNGVIQSDTVEVIKNLWEEFGEIYSTLTCTELSTEIRNDYLSKAKEWVNLLISLRDKRVGYKRENVTPYIHAWFITFPGSQKIIKP